MKRRAISEPTGAPANITKFVPSWRRIFYGKNIFRAPAISQNFTQFCALHQKRHSNFTKYCTCHKKLHSNSSLLDSSLYSIFLYSSLPSSSLYFSTLLYSSLLLSCLLYSTLRFSTLLLSTLVYDSLSLKNSVTRKFLMQTSFDQVVFSQDKSPSSLFVMDTMSC